MKIYITGLPSGYEVEHLARLFYPMAPLTQRGALEGSFMLATALAQVCLWMETPKPRVIKPTMGSPGSGLQHLANLMGVLSKPSTTTPSVA